MLLWERSKATREMNEGFSLNRTVRQKLREEKCWMNDCREYLRKQEGCLNFFDHFIQSTLYLIKLSLNIELNISLMCRHFYVHFPSVWLDQNNLTTLNDPVDLTFCFPTHPHRKTHRSPCEIVKKKRK